MNIQQLLERPENQPFSVREMSDVVVHYIHKRKGVRVELTIEENLQRYPQMFQIHQLHSQVLLLIEAFDKAKKWLKQNGE